MFYKILPADLHIDGIVYKLGLNLSGGPLHSDGRPLYLLEYITLEQIPYFLSSDTMIAEVEPKGTISEKNYSIAMETDKLYVHTISTVIDWFENQPDEVKQKIMAQPNADISVNGYSIQLYRNPSEEMKLTAVMASPSSIQLIENPSKEVQLAAVRKEGYAIQYIKNPSEDLLLESLVKSSHVIQYIENPSERVQLVAIAANPMNLLYIKNPSEVVQLAAVKQNPNAIRYIDNPSESVIQICELADAERTIKIAQHSVVLKYSV
jgi:hypothetical protein